MEGHMTTVPEDYLAKAHEFEGKAATTKIASARENYLSLARSYRELAAQKLRKSHQDDADAEALAKRVIGRP
jgi:hypothetical protein